MFDGSKPGAYTEDDPIAPLGVYGCTKAAGEAAVRGGNPRNVILCTAWVYGVHGGNFLKTMMRLAAERDRLRVVADQHGCLTATADIAEAILAIDSAFAHDPGSPTPSISTSWHGFAKAIVAPQEAHTGKRPPIDAIVTADYSTPAARPRKLRARLLAVCRGLRLSRKAVAGAYDRDCRVARWLKAIAKSAFADLL